MIANEQREEEKIQEELTVGRGKTIQSKRRIENIEKKQITNLIWLKC